MSSGGPPRRRLPSKDQEEIDRFLDSLKNEQGEIDNNKFKKEMQISMSNLQQELLKESNKKIAKSLGNGKKTRRRKSKKKKTRRRRR